MSKKKLTNKQKKLYGTLIAIAAILVLAFAKGKDIKQIFSNLIESGVDSDGLSESELQDLLTDTLVSSPDDSKENSGEDATGTMDDTTTTVTPTPEPAAPTEAPTPTTAPTNTPAPTTTPEPTETPTPEPTKSPLELVEEDGVYSTPELVAAYIYTFNKLPSNYITKNEATKLGWVSNKGNLWDVTDEMSIGGDKFGNYEGLLPKKNGRQWYECDVNYYGGYRGSERILYSNDGLIYYTDDHYESFTQLY